MINNKRIIPVLFVAAMFCLYAGCSKKYSVTSATAFLDPAVSTATVTDTVLVLSTATNTATIPVVASATSTAITIATATATTTATTVTVPVVPVQSHSLPACVPTPFNTGNAQIITANSSYTIHRIDIELVNCNYTTPAIITGTVRAEIQGVIPGPSFDIPDGTPLANGISSNTFDISLLDGCTVVSFNFPDCMVTSGSKFSFVLYGDVYDPDFNFRVNNNCLDYGNPDKKFVFTHDYISWNYTNSIEYYIY